MEMLRIPTLVFALGMYLPLELNLPALVGGVLSHYVTRRSERPGVDGRTMRERGVIIASGSWRAARSAASRRGAAALRLVLRGPRAHALLRPRGDLAAGVDRRLLAVLRAYLWWRATRVPAARPRDDGVRRRMQNDTTVLERFLRYVRYDTQSREGAEHVSEHAGTAGAAPRPRDRAAGARAHDAAIDDTAT
jgi:hypothetical protein